jgi:hypothetical protein
VAVCINTLYQNRTNSVENIGEILVKPLSASSFKKHLIAECIAWRFLCRIVPRSNKTCREYGSIKYTVLSKIEMICTKIINAQRNCVVLFRIVSKLVDKFKMEGEGGEFSSTSLARVLLLLYLF